MPHGCVSASAPGPAVGAARVLRTLVRAGLLLAVLVLAPAAGAEEGILQASHAQYVFLVDDSGSMGSDIEKHPSDPNRLAVFAARAMLGLLDDTDEASLVRLNGAIDGDAPVPIRPMSKEVRGNLEAMLATDQKIPHYIALYKGQQTPCTKAFDQVSEVLNAGRRDGVKQVLIYLTDGKCEGPNGSPDNFDAGRFLKSVKSANASPKEFLFYLLRFQKGDFTASLEKLASDTGGSTFPFTADDPTGILLPFAQALSQAQGFDATVVTPDKPVIGAHSAARGVRLLAVAGGSGEQLSIDFGSPKPTLLGEARTGEHHYQNLAAGQNGETYRYVVVDYVPGASSVKVSVGNAGANWKLIAIPDYRLQVRAKVVPGKCSESGNKSEVDAVETGSAVCVRANLENDKGTPVTSDELALVQPPSLSVTYQGPGKPSAPWPPSGDGTLPADGEYDFFPSATISRRNGSSDASLTLPGAPAKILASTKHMTSSLDSWPLGTLHPGDTSSTQVTLGGDLPQTPGTLRVVDADLPSCVHFSVDKVQPGGQVNLSPGPHTLGVSIDPLCSLTHPTLDADLAKVRIRLEAKSLPALEIPVTGALHAELGLPEKLAVQADRTGQATVKIPITGNQRGDLRLSASVSPPADGWPSKDLRLGFMPANGAAKMPADTLLQASELRIASDGSGDSAISVRVAPCCGEGTYHTTLTLRAPGGGAESREIPVDVTVGQGSWWACHGSQVMWALRILALLVVLWLLRNLYRNTYFIKVFNSDQLYIKLPGARFDSKYVPPIKKDSPSGRERLGHWFRNLGVLAAFGRVYREAMRAQPKIKPPKSIEWTLTLIAPVGSVRQQEATDALPRTPGFFVLASVEPDSPPRCFVRLPRTQTSIHLQQWDFKVQLPAGAKATAQEYMSVGPLDERLPLDSEEGDERIRLVAR